jgi:hypothetical protein
MKNLPNISQSKMPNLFFLRRKVRRSAAWMKNYAIFFSLQRGAKRKTLIIECVCVYNCPREGSGGEN